MTGSAYALDASVFSDKERRQIAEFSKKIPLGDFNKVVQYGGGIQRKIADFSDVILGSMQGHVQDDIGDKLVLTVKDMRGDYTPKDGFFSKFMSKNKDKPISRNKILKGDGQIEKVLFLMDDFQVQLLKDNAKLKQLRVRNKVYNKELKMYVAAGKLRLQADQVDTSKEDKQFIHIRDRFEKKVQDLEMTRVISNQMVPMIEMIHRNNTSIIQQIKVIKHQMDTVHTTNQALLEGLDEVLRVRMECESIRHKAEAEIRKLKKELSLGASDAGNHTET